MLVGVWLARLDGGGRMALGPENERVRAGLFLTTDSGDGTDGWFAREQIALE
jgi:hypothetical protein